MRSSGFQVQGPGILNAIQTATKARKNFCLVYDWDNRGNIIRLGYVLIKPGEKVKNSENVTWFKKDEAFVIYDSTPVPPNKLAKLDISFSVPNDSKARTHLLFLPLDKEGNLIIRHRFLIKKKSVVGFVMQVEVRDFVNGIEIWKPVIRYDCAHGFIHCDKITSKGIKTKNKLIVQNIKDAISFASTELKNNLNSWLIELGYKTLGNELSSDLIVVNEMDKAKEFLLDLCDNPNKIGNKESKFVQFKDKLDLKQGIWPPV